MHTRQYEQRFLAVLAGFLLAGCGGEGGAGSSPPTPPAPPPVNATDTALRNIIATEGLTGDPSQDRLSAQ